jgi:hypothetical protein
VAREFLAGPRGGGELVEDAQGALDGGGLAGVEWMLAAGCVPAVAV